MLSPEMNERLKDAVSGIRQFGEPIEIYWDRKTDSPFDEKIHGEWAGDLESTKTLRKWLAKNQPDGRRICVYCRGDYQAIIFDV